KARHRGRLLPVPKQRGDVAPPPGQTPPPSDQVPPPAVVPPSAPPSNEWDSADYPSVKTNGCGVNVGCPRGQQKADRCVLHNSGTHFIVKYDQCVTTVECAPAINLGDSAYYLFNVADYGGSCSVATSDRPIPTTICNPSA